jgi:hypothetical protein
MLFEGFVFELPGLLPTAPDVDPKMGLAVKEFLVAFSPKIFFPRLVNR